MLCSRCKQKQATYHEKIIHNGSAKDVFLCDDCKRERELLDNPFNIFKNFYVAFNSPSHSVSSQRDGLVCSKCGCTSGEYLDSGYVGCAECYQTFASMMEMAVKRLQKADSHVGKSPIIKSAEEIELERLYKEREIAIESEDYMLAQSLNERIKAIREGLAYE